MTKDQKQTIIYLFRLEKYYSDEISKLTELSIREDAKRMPNNIYNYYKNEHNRLMMLANENLDKIEKLTGKSYKRHQGFEWWKEDNNG